MSGCASLLAPPGKTYVESDLIFGAKVNWTTDEPIPAGYFGYFRRDRAIVEKGQNVKFVKIMKGVTWYGSADYIYQSTTVSVNNPLKIIPSTTQDLIDKHEDN